MIPDERTFSNCSRGVFLMMPRLVAMTRYVALREVGQGDRGHRHLAGLDLDARAG